MATVCLMLFSLPTFGQSRLAAVQQTGKAVRLTPTVKSMHKAAALPAPNKVSYRQEQLLLEEDFSKMTSGTEDHPDTTVCLASQNDAPGIYLDPSYTKQAGWAGDKVYSAGGAVFLRTYNMMSPAVLYTPIGDYSGEITVTCRMKALPNKTLYYDDKGNLQWGTTDGSTLTIQVGKGGVEKGDLAETDDPNDGYSVRLYPKHGWIYVTYKILNYSGNSDGFLAFFTEGSVVLDDIKITTAPTILGNPGGVKVTDFQPDNFTIEWQPVSRAYNYYVNLYKKVYTADGEQTYKEDFEDYKSGDDWTFTSSTVVDGMGKNGSKALMLQNGDEIVTPYNGSKYKNFKFWMKAVYPEGYTEEQIYTDEALIEIDLLTKDGWKYYSGFYGWGFVGDEYNDCDMNEEGWNLFDNGGYYGVRLRFANFPEGTKFYFDEAEAIANRGYQLEFVKGKYSADNGFGDDMTKYDMTEETSYTFKNLDPESEYFYGVRAHVMADKNLFSEWKLYECFEVAAPQVLEATDVDERGSFTAHWTPSPKATRYAVNLYSAYQTKNVETDHVLIDEKFDAVQTDSSTDVVELGNSSLSSLYEFTTLPGWTGRGNIVVNGMLGCNYVVTSVNKIVLPRIYVANGSWITLTLKAYGNVGDCLMFNVNGVDYPMEFVQTEESAYGMFSGSVKIPVSGLFVQPYIYSKTWSQFVIDELKITQDLTPNAYVFTWMENKEVDGDATTCDFSDLTDYDIYAYDVVAYMDQEDRTATSKPSGIMIVNLATGGSHLGLASTPYIYAGDTKVTSIHTIDGRNSSRMTKGVNILRMSDGTTRKVVVK
ncbi:MAG: hypothetical protein ACI4A7_07995 [Prevotella sp.]